MIKQIVSEYLSKIIPVGTLDKIKSSATGAYGNLFGWLSQAKTKFQNSANVSAAFCSLMADDLDYIEDGMMDSVINTAEPHLSTVDDSVSDSLVSLINKVGEYSDELGGHVLAITTNTGDAVSLAAIGGTIRCIDKNGQPTDTVLTAVEGGKSTLNNVWRTVSGEYISCWDIVKQQYTNSQINAALNDFASILSGPSSDLGGVVQSKCSELRSSGLEDLSQLASRISRGWAENKEYGVALAIYNYIAAAASTDVDSDTGLITFTDNSQFITSAYLAGFIGTVNTALGQIAHAIVVVFQKIISAVGSVIKAAIEGIACKIGYDLTYETRASLDINNSVKYLASCHAFGQVSSDFMEDPFQDTKYLEFCDGAGPFSVTVPGGIIYFSYNSAAKNTFNRYRAEFHPDLVDRRALIDSIVTDHSWSSTGAHHSVTGILPGLQSFYSLINGLGDDALNPTELVNDEDGLLSASQNALLSDIVLFNIFLFLSWQWLLNGTFDGQRFSRNGFAFSEFYSGSTKMLGFGLSVDSLSSRSVQDIFDGSTGRRYRYEQWIDLLSVVVARYYGDIDASHLTNAQWEEIANMAMYCDSSESGLQSTLVLSDGHSVDIIYSLDMADGVYSKGIYNQLVNPQYKTPHFGSFAVVSGSHWAVKAPKYSRVSILNAVIGSMIAAITIAAATVALYVTVRPAIRRKQAKLSAVAEQQWAKVVANPTTENLKNYRRTVRKNNFLCFLFGGTRLSKQGFWSGASSESGASQIFSDIGAEASGRSTPSEVATTNLDEIFQQLQLLIKGYQDPPIEENHPLNASE